MDAQELRRVACAANRDASGLVILGARHWDAFMHAQADSQSWGAGCHEQGFIDQRHYENTVADGTWPIRSLYTHPGAKGE